MNTLTKRNTLIFCTLTTIIGFAGGFLSKDCLDKNNEARASQPAPVPVHKLQAADTSNKLIGPGIWNVYMDPLWMPVDFAIRTMPLPSLMSFPTSMPKVQTVDGENELRVIAQVPGMNEKDVDVQVSNEAITIKGHKKQEHNQNKIFNSVEESFQQTVQLPCKVNPDRVQATVQDGVLTVSLPKESSNARAEQKTKL